MQIETISLFCDVAQNRSVSKAAVAHGVTQSAASQRVQALERELGVVLVDRSQRPLALTAAGETFHRGCRKLLDRYERLKREVAGSLGRADLRGEVTAAAIYSAGIDLLNQVRADFERDHPRASVRISYLQPEAVYQRVRHEQCDVGILSYPERWRGLASAPLREETMVVVGRSGHPLLSSAEPVEGEEERAGARGVIRASRLADHAMVSFDPSLPIGRRIRKYLRQQGVRPHVVNLFDNIDTIKTFVAETDAVAILPDRTVGREVSAGVLAAAALVPRLVRPVGIVYLRQRDQSALVRAFIEYLSDYQPTRRDEPATVTA